MNSMLEYTEPKLIDCEALFAKGDGGEYEDVSTAKFEASYDEDDSAHETIEL